MKGLLRAEEESPLAYSLTFWLASCRLRNHIEQSHLINCCLRLRGLLFSWRSPPFFTFTAFCTQQR